MQFKESSVVKPMSSESGRWWETGVIYQIYPLTFADGNQDGTGDLRGIIRRLDYLNDGNPNSETSLGIDAIWLSPINASPMVDNGYDIVDYRDVCSTFGSLEDFDELLEQAHQRGIKIILDLVVNHTSNQHPWFQDSCAGQDSSKADWYLWHDPAEGGGPPNNWQSYFGGTGWEYCESRHQYYYHTFNANQPDLNWHNPEVRAAVYDIMRFWLDRGVDGFRLDASSVYSKDPDFHDNPLKHGATDTDSYDSYHHLYTKNRPETHEFIREMRAIVDSYDDRALIGETFIDNRLYDSVIFHGSCQEELHLAINFEFPFSPWYPGHIQREIEKQEILTKETDWPCYFLDNHDVPRHLSRWIECSLCIDSSTIAKAAAALLLTVRGTPLMYYGQELGMEDHDDIPEDRLQDGALAQCNSQECPPPRDGARTPMQWDSSPQAGFSFGENIEPWLPVHPNYQELNVQNSLEDPDSILNFYRRLLQVRKQSEALRQGRWRSLIHYPYEHLAYVRETPAETVLVLINFAFEQPLKTDIAVDREGWQVLLSTHHEDGKWVDIGDRLQSFEVSVFQRLQAD